MNFENEIRKKLEQENFSKNNGRIVRTINVLSGKFISLDAVCSALMEYMNEGEFEQGIIYLHKACYIEIRMKYTHKILDDFEKHSYSELECSLTQKGIKLARGFVEDEAVDM